MKDQIPEYAVGWGTLALINAGLAQAKNRRGLIWFFLSLLLGPIATLILVILAKAEPPDAAERRRKRFNLQDFRQQ